MSLRGTAEREKKNVLRTAQPGVRAETRNSNTIAVIWRKSGMSWAGLFFAVAQYRIAGGF